jgi:hypothetical protein
MEKMTRDQDYFHQGHFAKQKIDSVTTLCSDSNCPRQMKPTNVEHLPLKLAMWTVI